MTTAPRLVDIHIVEIDPTAAGIDFFVSPSNGSSPGETNHQTTSGFVTQHNLQIGLNANFTAYAPSAPYMDVLGIAASNGDVYSPFYAGWPGINITQNNQVNMVQAVAGNISHDPPDYYSGYAPNPNVPLYNAVGGNEHIVHNGQNIATWADGLHPRSAMGVTAAGHLLLFAVDGRNTGHSLGMSTSEVADVLIGYGAVEAMNLDGGGSTTLVFSDPAPRLVNVPVGVSNVPGTERNVGCNFGVYAAVHAQPQASRYVFADFEQADQGLFTQSPGYSGSTQGINEAASTSAAVQGIAHSGQWSQRLQIVNDPAAGSDQNPSGGWFVRHLSGSNANRTQNHARPSSGYIGFWAMTSDAGVSVALALDDTNNVTADRSTRKTLIADGQWHLYEWNLEDDDLWEAWVSGNGAIDTPDFTLDSLQFFGPHANATIYIDDLMHFSGGSLLPEPTAAVLAGISVGSLLFRRP
ncbi:MAG: phosphodiester glycosidase family protein [Phycisphaeraceae bacterium]|nr:phosphodiester glycosidase family protein [Phycisphaeraceae bacterium]